MRIRCPPDNQDTAYDYVRLNCLRLELSNFGSFIASHVYIYMCVCVCVCVCVYMCVCMCVCVTTYSTMKNDCKVYVTVYVLKFT